jgi:hypothetical protein
MRTDPSRCLALVAAVVAVAAAPTLTAQDVDQLTGQPPQPPNQIVLEPVSEMPGAQDIIWDLTHGVYLNYEPSGDFAPLVTVLQASGYTVTTTNTGIDTIDLSPYQIMVLCVASTADSAYTPAEVAVIQNFVQAGGGLFLMGDNPASWPQNIDPVAQAFGVTTGQSDSVAPFTDFDPHPVTTGVSELSPIAAGNLAVTPPSTTIGRDGTAQPLLTVAEVLSGKVVIFGDVNTCSTRITLADNQLFCENVFGWLTTPVPVNLQGLTIE